MFIFIVESKIKYEVLHVLLYPLFVVLYILCLKVFALIASSYKVLY